MGDTKGGPFDIDAETAARMLAQPNPDGRSNADVVRPWVNGLDITRRSRGMWVIDFGVDMTEAEAALRISALVARELAEFVDRSERYEAARRRALKLMADATKRGDRSWTRDELYDRWPS